MAVFLPFRGARYADSGSRISALVSPPYDIIGETGRESLLACDADNIICAELPRGNEERYENARNELSRLFESGALKKDESPRYYVYRMSFSLEGEQLSVCGFVGRMQLTPFCDGVVLPHENTLPRAKDDRLSLLKACRCNISSVYSLVPDDDGALSSILCEVSSGEALHRAVQDEVVHELFSVPDHLTERVRNAFEEKKVYIADGHHRYETGLNYIEFLKASGAAPGPDDAASYIMMTCVPENSRGLAVLPTHRMVIRCDGGYDREKLLSRCLEYFSIERVCPDTAQAMLRGEYVRGNTAFLLYDKEFFLLHGCKNIDKSGPLEALDVSALHTYVIGKGLGISVKQVTDGGFVNYTRDFDEAVACVDSGAALCALLLNPTRTSEIVSVADAGGRMPQKSTYFFPKLITGLVINPFD